LAIGRRVNVAWLLTEVLSDCCDERTRVKLSYEAWGLEHCTSWGNLVHDDETRNHEWQFETRNVILRVTRESWKRSWEPERANDVQW
jgi:hypothetical protein